VRIRQKFGCGGPSNKANKKKPPRVAITDPSFKGRVKELEGFYFDFMPNTLNRESLEETLKAVVSFVGRGGGGDFKNGNLVARGLEDLTPITLAQPASTDPTFSGNTRLFNKAEGQWLDRVQKVANQM